MNPLHVEIADLRRENETLKAELAILREDLAPPAIVRFVGLETSQREGQVLALLRRRESVSLAQVSLALWGDQPPASEKTLVRVLISRLRAKLTPIGVEIIHTLHEGYRIPAEQKARLQPVGEPS